MAVETNNEFSAHGVFRAFFKFIRRSIFVVFFVLSLILNIGLVVSASIQTFVATTVSTILGVKTAYGALTDRFVAKSDDLARTSSELASERVVNRELRGEVAELAVEREALRQARGEIYDISRGLPPRRLSVEIREETADTIERIARRTAVGTSREIATAPAEAIPFWGSVVIVSSIGLDLWDMCQNMKDLTELQVLIDPDFAVPEDRLEVCNVKVPTAGELWEATRSAPENAWNTARDAMPTASDLQEIEMPEIVWSELGGKISDATASWWGERKTDGRESWEWVKRWATE